MSLKNLSVTTKIHKILIEKLKNNKINNIYKNFEKTITRSKNFAVAVSGGPDSLALSFFVKVYSIKKKMSPKFFIVDHKLRKDSTTEAIKVKNLLKNFSISAQILTWKGKKPKKNIQALARAKRYQLLIKNCKKFKLDSIILGHHQDDLIENFFLRMFRSSGLRGLTSLDINSKFSEKNLNRPLLYQKKEDLVFVAKNVFGYYVKDPSNNHDKFQRIKIRKFLQGLKEIGLEKEKIYKSIKNLKSPSKIIDHYVVENINKNTFLNKKEDRLFLNKTFFKKPFEVVFRSLSELIKLIGKKDHFVRGKKMTQLINEIQNNSYFKATLGGCIIEKVNLTVIISKE